MTCLTKNNFVPTKKPDTRYTIRMYALKVPPNLLVNGRGPKVSMQGGYDKSAFTPDTEDHTAGWKYFGTIAPKTASVAFRDMLKVLLTQAADEHEASHNSPARPTFVLGPNGRISDCYDANNQRAQACTCTLFTNSSRTFSCPAGNSYCYLQAAMASTPFTSDDAAKRHVLWDVFSGTGSVGSIFRDEFGWTVYSIDIKKSSAKRSNGVCSDVLTFDFSKWPRPNLI